MLEGVTLEWENAVVLSVMQALWGFVSPQLQGVAVEVKPTEVTVFFAVTHNDDEQLDEDIDDIIDEVVIYLGPERPDVSKRVHVGSAWVGWEGRERGRRLVLLSKDEEDAAGGDG